MVRHRVFLRVAAIAVGSTVVIVVLLVWLAGGFSRKIPHDQASLQASRPVGDATLVPASVRLVPMTESAVGTIRAVHEASVASKLLAKVRAVNVQAGQHVGEGELLVRLDDEDLQARRAQAEAAVSAAAATREQARIELDRVTGLFEQNAAAKLELERAQTTRDGAEAELDRAREAQREAETVLGYATIASPMSGIVVEKQVEPGDMVTPGQVLLRLYDPTRMQLVASVRESLTRRLEVGQTIGVHVAALGKTCDGRISEIVPEAESASRTFAVKVTGPCPPGIFSGMFGRLLIPLDTQEVLVIPRSAVRHVGQLHLVDVAQDGRLTRRLIQPGRVFDDDLEVLSGLREGEQVAVPSVTRES